MKAEAPIELDDWGNIVEHSRSSFRPLPSISQTAMIDNMRGQTRGQTYARIGAGLGHDHSGSAAWVVSRIAHMLAFVWIFVLVAACLDGVGDGMALLIIMSVPVLLFWFAAQLAPRIVRRLTDQYSE